MITINSKECNKLLIIGKVPPPIGGVTIHTKRLINLLLNKRIPSTFLNLHHFGLGRFLRTMYKANVAHNHSNNRLFLFLFVIYGRLCRTRTIITIHGNVNKLGKWKVFFEKLAIKMSDVPILLNKESYSYAINHNEQSRLLSSFIPPSNDELELPPSIKDKILDLKAKHTIVYATNATSYAKDSEGQEIYGITDLFEIFKENKKRALVISDPSGEYYTILNKNIPENILLLSLPHSFLGVINITDVLIRATSTDGDSISIKEALYLGKSVITSNCVSRPGEVILYEKNNWKQLAKIIDEHNPREFKLNIVQKYDDVDELLNIYEYEKSISNMN